MVQAATNSVPPSVAAAPNHKPYDPAKRTPAQDAQGARVAEHLQPASQADWDQVGSGVTAPAPRSGSGRSVVGVFFVTALIVTVLGAVGFYVFKCALVAMLLVRVLQACCCQTHFGAAKLWWIVEFALSSIAVGC